MTDTMLALSLVAGILTAETQLLGRMRATYRLLDDEDAGDSCVPVAEPWSGCLPPRLDHAAPGQGRTPRALCLVLGRAGLARDLVTEAPCD